MAVYIHYKCRKCYGSTLHVPSIHFSYVLLVNISLFRACRTAAAATTACLIDAIRLYEQVDCGAHRHAGIAVAAMCGGNLNPVYCIHYDAEPRVRWCLRSGWVIIDMHVSV